MAVRGIISQALVYKHIFQVVQLHHVFVKEFENWNATGTKRETSFVGPPVFSFNQ
jgi:hypothetical protein